MDRATNPHRSPRSTSIRVGRRSPDAPWEVQAGGVGTVRPPAPRGAWCVASCLVWAAACVVARPAAPVSAPAGPPAPAASSRCDSTLRSTLHALGLPPAVAADVRHTLAAYGGVVLRWPPTRRAPIRVWVQPPRFAISHEATLEASAAEDWVALVLGGARAWDGAARGVAFEATRDSAAADVRVLWDRAATTAARPVRGHTAVVASRSGVIAEASVTLVGAGSGAARTRPADVRAMAAHEFGHVLGLAHRSDPGSVLTPRVRADGVSAGDRAVLRAWYALPPGPLCR